MEEHAQRTEGVTIVLVPPNTVDPTVKVSVIVFSRVRFLPRRVVILFALKELFTFVLYLQLMNVKSVTSTRSVLMDIVDVNMDIMATGTNAKKEASTVDSLKFNLSLRNKKSNCRNNTLVVLVEAFMHQSIPAVPIPPGQPRGICSRCQSRAWGIRNFIAAPGAGH